jgi:hypothetical protein
MDNAKAVLGIPSIPQSDFEMLRQLLLCETYS